MYVCIYIYIHTYIILASGAWTHFRIWQPRVTGVVTDSHVQFDLRHDVRMRGMQNSRYSCCYILPGTKHSHGHPLFMNIYPLKAFNNLHF